MNFMNKLQCRKMVVFSIQTLTYPKKDIRIQHNYLWDMKLRKQLFNGFEKGLHIVQYSPDVNTIACVRGGNIKLFKKQNFEIKWEMSQGVGGALTGIAFSPDSKYLATGETGSLKDFNDIQIWDVESGKLSYRYSNYSKEIYSQDNLTFSNNGKLILGSLSKGLIVYNAIYNTTKVEPLIINDTTFVMPNPATKKISLTLENNMNLFLKMINNTGREIDIASHTNILNNLIEINIESLSNGTYYLSLIQNNISKTYKFIKD